MASSYVSVGVMAGTAQEKYRDLQRGCCETWIPLCAEKVYLFCGDHYEFDFESEMSDLTNKAEFIHFNNVGEDYNSASQKFWYGLAWLMDNAPAEWYAMFGTDNYVRYDRMIDMLNQFDGKIPLTLGASTQYRCLKVDGVDIQAPFNIGGGGNFITHSAIKMVFDQHRLDQDDDCSYTECARRLIEKWNAISVESKRTDLIPACDVALGYYTFNLDIPMIAVRGLCPIDWTGHQYWAMNGCFFSFKLESIIVCHYMSRLLMHEYHQYLGYEDKIDNIGLEIINQNYSEVASKPSDIYEHIPTLYSYASECGTIAEMGVRSIVSTWAFLKGLVESTSDASSKKLYCVDIEDIPRIGRVKEVAKTAGISLTFIHGDSAKITLPTEVDLLFIDTWHIYGHLKREFKQHHHKVKKYIILHDTTVDEYLGESLRLGSDLNKQAKESGYPIHEIARGLWPAVEEFLAEHREWTLHVRYVNCNGLTVLKRIDS